jgi:MoxR-like ATPase
MPKRWNIFQADQPPGDYINDLPPAPPWRQFKGEPDADYRYPLTSEDLRSRGHGFQTDKEKGAMVRMVNAALCLRRPLLVTGEPGAGKSTLVYAVAYQLQLGDILKWPITSRSSLQHGLYQYDAIGRLQEAQMEKTRPDIGKYIKLGPLGTALLPTRRPRALLIDEIDKSDLDLPNDLLHVFEEGEFVIPELARLNEETVTVKDAHGLPVTIRKGRVKCCEFPFVVMTSNGEREFPAPFLRRCLRLEMPKPDEPMLRSIVESRLDDRAVADKAGALIRDFLKRKEARALATDQLLNAVYLLKTNLGVEPKEEDELLKALLRELTNEIPE